MIEILKTILSKFLENIRNHLILIPQTFCKIFKLYESLENKFQNLKNLRNEKFLGSLKSLQRCLKISEKIQKSSNNQRF